MEEKYSEEAFQKIIEEKEEQLIKAAEIGKKLLEENAELKVEVEKLKQRNEILFEKNEEARVEKEEAQKNLDSLRRFEVEAMKENERLNQTLNEKEKTISILMEKEKKQAILFKEQSSLLKKLELELIETDNENMNLEEQLQKLSKQVSSQQKENDLLNLKIKSQTCQEKENSLFSNQKNKNKELKEELLDLALQLQQSQTQIQTLTQERDQLETGIVEITRKYEKLSKMFEEEQNLSHKSNSPLIPHNNNSPSQFETLSQFLPLQPNEQNKFQELQSPKEESLESQLIGSETIPIVDVEKVLERKKVESSGELRASEENEGYQNYILMTLSALQIQFKNFAFPSKTLFLTFFFKKKKGSV